MALIVALQNMSGLAEVSDYHWKVYVNERLIDEGWVVGHRRSDGWAPLVERMLTQRKERERDQSEDAQA